MKSAPNSRTNLDKAIQRFAGPPAIVPGPEWPELYAEQSANVPVLPTVEEAVAWTQRLIDRIDAAR